jgi:ubiquinone/menaquinone biosynthesis C-methylase UbiE
MVAMCSPPFKEYSCLHFAKDNCVDPDWFKKYTFSEYGYDNSLDMQNINLPDSSFDIVICNHVLEDIADDIRSLQELQRILTPRGLLQLTVPSPLQKEKTEDWGYPDKLRGHYRTYGADIIELFHKALNKGYLISIVARDDVTGMDDVVFLISKSPELSKSLSTSPSIFFKILSHA